MLNARTRLLVALVPAVVTFAVIALASVSARALQHAVGWVDHTRQVIDRDDAVLARAVDAETGQRGYLVTGDTGFLASGHGAQDDVRQSLGELRRLTMDNPVQQARLDTLERALAIRFRMLDSGIVLRRAGLVAPLAKGDLLRDGRARMDEARRLLAEVKSEEQRLLVQRRSLADQRLRITTLVLVLGGLLSVTTALVVNMLLNRIITEREQMTRELGAQLGDLVAARRELAARAAAASSPPPSRS